MLLRDIRGIECRCREGHRTTCVLEVGKQHLPHTLARERNKREIIFFFFFFSWLATDHRPKALVSFSLLGDCQGTFKSRRHCHRIKRAGPTRYRRRSSVFQHTSEILHNSFSVASSKTAVVCAPSPVVVIIRQWFSVCYIPHMIPRLILLVWWLTYTRLSWFPFSRLKNEEKTFQFRWLETEENRKDHHHQKENHYKSQPLIWVAWQNSWISAGRENFQLR